jgi:carboxypeptidase Taq
MVTGSALGIDAITELRAFAHPADIRLTTVGMTIAMTRRAKRKAATRNTATGSPPHSPPSRAPAQRSAEALLEELRRRLLEINDLTAAASLLNWDQATYMPQGGAGARARQNATLHRLAHERLVDAAVGKLLDALQSYSDALAPDADDASLLRVVRRDFEKAIKVPPEYVARANAHAAASYDAWTRARPANDFAAMLPFLEQTLDLSREYAGFFVPYDHIADPLIDDADEGMTTAAIGALFSQLRGELALLVRAISQRPPTDDACLYGSFDEQAQFELGLRMAARMGYDLARGRLDRTHHPFCTKFSLGDVRITTRVYESDVARGLFSTLHEAGHAIYEQGISFAFEGTPVGKGASAGVHESQSRLWENVVGRSRGFWRHFYPGLRSAFPDQLGRVGLETFYRAINKVTPSLIRADADEVTYNLHVMMRFDLELKLLDGSLRVRDLPEAWRAGMQDMLGLVPLDDRDGCLQDVHWYSGSIGGAFQSYTIGNVLGAQFYAAALEAHPQIPNEIEAGEFSTLHGWLKDNLYRHGRKYLPTELIERTTGEFSVRPYLAYLRAKYGEIYGLPVT